MSRRSLTILAMSVAFTLAACSGGAATTTAPATDPPAASVPAPASADPGGGTAACTPSSDAGTVAAAMSEFTFVPATVQAKVGDVIAWTNGDSAAHTATLKDDTACTTARLSNGETGGLTFSAAGSYPFFCKIHPDMKGTIEITS